MYIEFTILLGVSNTAIADKIDEINKIATADKALKKGRKGKDKGK